MVARKRPGLGNITGKKRPPLKRPGGPGGSTKPTRPGLGGVMGKGKPPRGKAGTWEAAGGLAKTKNTKPREKRVIYN